MIPDWSMDSPSFPHVPDSSIACVRGGQEEVIPETGFEHPPCSFASGTVVLGLGERSRFVVVATFAGGGAAVLPNPSILSRSILYNSKRFSSQERGYMSPRVATP
jgi:hypothetical protein